MSPDLAALETKLAAARTRLILEKPFLGALVMHLPLKAADAKWCATTATDARAFYFNPGYIARLSLEQTQFVLAHEAMHCALSHFHRRGHRLRRRWDVACDYAVNMILDEERLQAPDAALMNAVYRGLTAEEIYPLLHEDPPEQTQDLHLFDAGGGDAGQPETQDASERSESTAEASGANESDQSQEAGEAGSSADEPPADGAQPPPPPTDTDKLDEQWKARLAAAAQAARQAGKLSQSMQRLVDDLLSPQLPWRALLARYLMNAARDDYSFQRLSRREVDALMPRLYSQSVNLQVVLDSSGSISRQELQEFLTEIDALKAQMRAEVTLHACDNQLDANGPWHFSMWDSLVLPESLNGGGGTDFRPVFEWIGRQQNPPHVLVYFTDAEGVFPPLEPDYPVIWLVKGKARVPFGVRVQLN
jgi:predicted metal-dependent peptidase